MPSCPDNYTSLTTLCIPNSWNLTPTEMDLLKQKLVKVVVLMLPDRFPVIRDIEPPVANGAGGAR
jgi:hypothetical protein